MIKIRCNVFETNSSSTHSIAIGNNLKYDILDLEEPYFTKNEDGEYIMNTDADDITYEFNILTTLTEKTFYLAYNEYDIESINEALKGIIPNFKRLKKDNNEYSEYTIAGIDIDCFLRNPNYVIILDNDNEYVYDDLTESNLLTISKYKTI